MKKLCISCGMPMEKSEDFASQDLSKDYCVHCARPDGSMRSYEEALVGFSAFIVKTQGLDPAAARAAAKNLLAQMPAWSVARTSKV